MYAARALLQYGNPVSPDPHHLPLTPYNQHQPPLPASIPPFQLRTCRAYITTGLADVLYTSSCYASVSYTWSNVNRYVAHCPGSSCWPSNEVAASNSALSATVMLMRLESTATVDWKGLALSSSRASGGRTLMTTWRRATLGFLDIWFASRASLKLSFTPQRPRCMLNRGEGPYGVSHDSKATQGTML